MFFFCFSAEFINIVIVFCPFVTSYFGFFAFNNDPSTVAVIEKSPLGTCSLNNLMFLIVSSKYFLFPLITPGVLH